MYMKRYEVELTGATPLIMHNNNIKWRERTTAWQKDPANKKLSKAGDDRTPGWLWLGYCYHQEGLLTVDSDNLMAMLRDAGKKCPAMVGRGSLKAATQSGIIVDQIGWPVITPKGTVSWDRLLQEQDNTCFEEHEALADSLGFELFCKSASIGKAKHIRARPRFNAWALRGTVTVLDESLGLAVLHNLFSQAGRFVGLCDWRPGSPIQSGQFGMFTTTLTEIKQ